MLITFICLGKFLEATAKGRTSEAITALMNLTPTQAVLVHSDPTTGMQWEQDIEAKLAQRGDTLKVYPGSKIPTDGVVQQVRCLATSRRPRQVDTCGHAVCESPGAAQCGRYETSYRLSVWWGCATREHRVSRMWTSP
jgi:hypothetical protein